jgi:hypothetical protein
MLLPLFEWFEATGLGQVVRQSLWLSPVIEAAHLLGLGLLGGSLLIVDLRMFGVGLRNQGIAELADRARPWLVGSVVLMLLAGILLFLSEAVKAYYNRSFLVKMIALAIALVYTFVVRDRITRDEALDTSPRSRLVAATSIAIWFTVAAAGRWIGTPSFPFPCAPDSEHRAKC